MKLQLPRHEYQVGNFHVTTRDAARMIKRALKGDNPEIQIIQRTVTEKIIR